MSRKMVERVYAALKNGEPQTPNEIAIAIGLNQKTAQIALMELASRKEDVQCKKIGRYRLFWKQDRQEARGHREGRK